VAQYVRPKKEFKVKLKDADKDFVFDTTEADLNKFDKIIDEIEPGALRLPVLLKKYIKQNAKLVAFNVDRILVRHIILILLIKKSLLDFLKKSLTKICSCEIFKISFNFFSSF